jgi:hypothetical protein
MQTDRRFDGCDRDGSAFVIVVTWGRVSLVAAPRGRGMTRDRVAGRCGGELWPGPLLRPQLPAKNDGHK